MYTVKDLIEKLSTLPPDTPIVLSSDSEGNLYSRLSDLSGDYYARKDELDSYYLDSIVSEEDIKDDDWSEEEVGQYLTKIVVLWP